MKLRILWIGSRVTFALAGLASAQPAADPPTRVARLNYLDGSVSFRPGNLQEWAPATLNFPLSTGDHLWTDRNAHAELHVGATAIHMAPWTALNVMRLDDGVTQLSVAEGTLYLRIPRLDEGESIEVDTPNGSLSVVRPGAYRVNVDAGNDATSFIVRTGEAEVSGGGKVTPVHVGQMIQLVANADVASIQDAPPPDPWEDWCVGRDSLSERALEVSESYVTPEMEGAEDLGSYGDWSTDGSYGAVWIPRHLPAGWAPYRNGHWAYVGPWGWTWIDDAPWGFAPFHYGRWVRLDSGWMWVPGNRILHPVYSPAMVAFVASSASRSGRVSAWIPLAPGEMFRPGYRATEQYVRRINLPEGRNLTRAPAAELSYANRLYGVAVPLEAFTGARAVSSATVRFPDATRPAMPDASPSRESFLGRRIPSSRIVASPPSQVTERAVIVRRELPPDVQPAAPIRGAVRAPETAPVAAAPPDRTERRDDTQPDAAPTVYLSLPPARQQRQEEARHESPTPVQRHEEAAAPALVPARREETRREVSVPTPQRHEETRHEAAAPAPQRHEETRHETAAPAPQRHEEARHEAPPAAAPQRHEETRHEAPAAAPQRHEESRPSPAPDRAQDKKDDSGSSRKK